MEKLFLHIGHSKTGSSYLQSFLALNREKLLDMDIDYPKGKAINRAKKGLITSGNFDILYSNYLNIESLSSSKNLLFSGEPIFNSLSKKPNRKPWMVDFLKNNAEKIEVNLFVRNLFSFLFTSYGQNIKRSGLYTDMNSFLQKTNFGLSQFNLILYWIKLSKEFGFKINIRNYSKHKENLLDIFLKDLFGDKQKDINFIIPNQNKINRSLTFSEYEFQRVSNYLNLKTPISPLSDSLVQELPEIRSMKITCSSETYEIVKNKNMEIIDSINSELDKNESIVIESPEDVVSDDNDPISSALSIDQIKIIASYFKENLNKENSKSNDNHINTIRDIALKIANKESMDINEALILMKIAKEFRPNGSLINSCVEKWEKELEGRVNN